MASLDWSQCPVVGRTPGKVSGAWVFRGTRTPVAVVFETMEDGMTIDEVIEQFAVSKGVAPVGASFLDDVVRQGRADAPRRPVVDENPHQRTWRRDEMNGAALLHAPVPRVLRSRNTFSRAVPPPAATSARSRKWPVRL